MILRSA